MLNPVSASSHITRAGSKLFCSSRHGQSLPGGEPLKGLLKLTRTNIVTHNVAFEHKKKIGSSETETVEMTHRVPKYRLCNRVDLSSIWKVHVFIAFLVSLVIAEIYSKTGYIMRNNKTVIF